MIAAYAFFVIVYRQREMMELNEIKYDVSTITAMDFSCELEISPKAFNDFLHNEYYPKAARSNLKFTKGMYLKQYLKKKIDEILSNYYRTTERLKKGREDFEKNSFLSFKSGKTQNMDKRR